MRVRRDAALMVAVVVPVAVVILLGAVAWACTQNMQGSIHFTNSAQSPAFSCPAQTGLPTSYSAAPLATAYTHACELKVNDTLTPDNRYELRVAAVGGNTGSALCHNSPLVLKNDTSLDGFFYADANGKWTNQQVTFALGGEDMAPGSYTVCAATPTAVDSTQPGLETGWWSYKLNLTIT